MTWDEALTYDSIVKDVARNWAIRCGDESLEDDIYQHIYMMLVLKVNTDNAQDKQTYVKSAAWRIAYKFVKRYGVSKHLSLDAIEANGFQVDENRQVRLPDYTLRFESNYDDCN